MPDTSDFRLLNALAEELKLPLVQIARQSELDNSRTIQYTSEMALKLIDSYILGLETSDQTRLQLEPVTLSSVLYDAAESLQPYARQQGYVIKVDIARKFGPIMGDRRLLQHAFTILGYELMNTEPEDDRATLTFATHASQNRIVAGVFTDNPNVTADAFRRAKALIGTARQTMPGTSASNGAGIFIADKLLNNVSSSFKIARHNKQVGLAASLLPSKQLSLV